MKDGHRVPVNNSMVVLLKSLKSSCPLGSQEMWTPSTCPCAGPVDWRLSAASLMWRGGCKNSYHMMFNVIVEVRMILNRSIKLDIIFNGIDYQIRYYLQ